MQLQPGTYNICEHVQTSNLNKDRQHLTEWKKNNSQFPLSGSTKQNYRKPISSPYFKFNSLFNFIGLSKEHIGSYNGRRDIYQMYSDEVEHSLELSKYKVQVCTTHSTEKPVTTTLTYPWKCAVLHCNHLGNTWKPLVLMT